MNGTNSANSANSANSISGSQGTNSANGANAIPERYVERVYAGFLGMNVGIRLGAPIEPVVWTHDRIRQVYGDIRGYVKDYTNFSADDDANGPIFFIRALYDDAVDRELEPQDVAKAWMNYAREGIGMFWWGGEGVSTEHTAYLNLIKGIPAPRSGSAEVNGIVLAEQIGGQIFVDSWGLLFPGRMEKAAEYAEKAASVSHDGNGLYGARFMAAAIAKAFDAASIRETVDAGLAQIPADSTYARVVRAVIDFHRERPDDFRACFKYLESEWGYDKYPGVCHIIPNAGVCILALLYGEGDFARTVEIASMCGWDTDCNAGNVGTILGVFAGLDGIPERYRKPINDQIVASSVSGYLNIVDLPTFAKELALLGYKLAGAPSPSSLVRGVRPGELAFDFDLPGSTHGFRVGNAFKTNVIRHSRDRSLRDGGGSLEVVFDRLVKGDSSKVYFKPYYRREDFNDEKYKPTFAPQAYSGQTVSAQVYVDQWEGEPIVLTPYVRETFTKREVRLEPVVTPANGAWTPLAFVIPDLDGSFADELGWIVESPSPLANRAIGTMHLGEFRVTGQAAYTIDFAKQAIEYTCVTPFAHHRGTWSLDGSAMRCASEEDASAFTGNYYARNYRAEMTVRPVTGDSHGLLVRSIGAMRHYFAGFDGAGKVSIVKRDFGSVRLAEAAFEWRPGVDYRLRVEAIGDRIALYVDDRLAVEARDASFGYGMFGCGHLRGGETLFADAGYADVGDSEDGNTVETTQ